MSTGCFRLAIRLQCKVIPSSRRIMMQLITAGWYGDLATNYMHPLRYRVLKGRPYGCADECQAGRPCFAILFVLLTERRRPRNRASGKAPPCARCYVIHPRSGRVAFCWCYELFTDMIEFGPSRCAGRIVTVTHVHGAHASPRRPRRSENPHKNPRRGRISTAPTRR